MLTKIKFLFFMSLISLALNAQNDPYSLMDNNSYYNTFLKFKEKKDSFMRSKYRDIFLQASGTLYSQIGEYQKAADIFNRRNKEMGYIPDSLINIDLSGYGITQHDLDNLYNKYNVVMFNEAHHLSEHRAFVFSQLKNLKNLGYNQLALEALNQNDSNINKRKYPVKSTGFYINDPVFGNLIRKAIQFGFILIDYDSYGPEREKKQAENILHKYDPSKGKLVILGGYGHIAETGNYKMMGQYFKKMIKEDILSISQFSQYHIKPIFPNNTDFKFFMQKDTTEYFDYYIYAKPQISETNIPYWYDWMNFKTKPLKDIYSEPILFPTLVQILNINEKNAVPVYQYIIEKQENVYIAFPKTGDYILKIIDKNGEKEYKFHL